MINLSTGSTTTAPSSQLIGPNPFRDIIQSNCTMASSANRKEVSFGFVTTHEFYPAIGDNPGVQDGIPIRLCSPVGPPVTVSFTKFEQTRVRRRRRPVRRLTPQERVSYLRSHGVPLREIQEAQLMAEEREEMKLMTSQSRVGQLSTWHKRIHCVAPQRNLGEFLFARLSPMRRQRAHVYV